MLCRLVVRPSRCPVGAHRYMTGGYGWPNPTPRSGQEIARSDPLWSTVVTTVAVVASLQIDYLAGIEFQSGSGRPTWLSCVVVLWRRGAWLPDVVSNDRMIKVVLVKSIDSGIMSSIASSSRRSIRQRICATVRVIASTLFKSTMEVDHPNCSGALKIS